MGHIKIKQLLIPVIAIMLNKIDANKAPIINGDELKLMILFM